jgi:hypothetical protein
MKKHVVAVGLTAALGFLPVIASAAFIDPLQGYTGPVKIKYSDYEQLNIPEGCLPAGCTIANPNTTNGGDNYGVIDITSILTPTNVPIWQKGDLGIELTAVFGGIGIAAITPNGSGFDVNSVGGTISVYENPLGTFDPTLGVSGFNATNTSYSTISGGTLYLTMDFASGCDPANPLFTICGQTQTTTFPFTGHSSSFMNVTGGPAGPQYDTNGINSPFGPRDFSITNNFCPNGEAGCQGQNGPENAIGDWQFLSEDPVVGNVRAVPEPGTLALLGLGLLGAVALRGRKQG